MNAESSHVDETTWAYLHGELADGERRAFDARLAGDPLLRRQCDQARRLDALLRTALPEVDQAALPDAILTEQATAAWERDQEAGLPAGTGTGRHAASRFRRIRPAVAGLAGLAAAVLAILALLPARHEAAPARWAPVEFVPLVTRGPASLPSRPALGARDARRAQVALAESLAWALADREGVLPGNLTLSLRLRELPGGAFAAWVRAEAEDGSLRGEWNGDYSSLERFLEQADASAARLAEALALPAAAEAAGGKRLLPRE